MKIVVTGAGGFIGSHIVRILSRTHEVISLLRPASDDRFLRHHNTEILRVDTEDPDALRSALAGAEAVVHAAAKVADWGDRKTFERTNIDLVNRLLDCAPATARIILISSNAVLGEEDCPRAKSADEPYNPRLPYILEDWLPSAMNHYRETKAEGERLALERCAREGRDLVVIRPVWVFGPREFHAGPFEYCETVLSGLPVMPGCDRNHFHVVYAPDLARMVARIIEHPSPRRVYLAGYPEAPKMSKYWAIWCQALGRRAPWHLPKWLLMLPALGLEALWTLVGAKNPPLFTRARVEMFYASNVYDTAPLAEDTEFTEFTPLDKAINTTVRWWRMYGFLPRQGQKPGVGD